MLEQSVKPGHLYIVSTPIGNLSDMSQRAIAVLSQVNLIACEDTRHTQKLLSHFQISNRTVSLHDHNERQRQDMIAEKLQAGESIALVSDAGTPLISDPGFHIVRHCRQLGLNVSPIPGACAAIAALSVTGLPTDRFTFEGFLPVKQQARINRLTTLANESRTMVFYDAPRRIQDTVQDIISVMGSDRYVVLAREITKTFETIHGDTAENLLSWLNADPNQQKGELVVIIEGMVRQEDDISVEVEQMLKLLLKELPPKKACALAAEITGIKKNKLYQHTLTLK